MSNIRCLIVGVALGACRPEDPVTLGSGDPSEPGSPEAPDPETEPTPTEPTAPSTDTGTTPTDAPAITLALTPEVASAGEVVLLEVTVEGYELVNPNLVPSVVEGQGHFHLYADGVYVAARWSEDPLELEVTADAAPGDLALRVALVTSQHDEIVPTVEATATLTVE